MPGDPAGVGRLRRAAHVSKARPESKAGAAGRGVGVTAAASPCPGQQDPRCGETTGRGSHARPRASASAVVSVLVLPARAVRALVVPRRVVARARALVGGAAPVAAPARFHPSGPSLDGSYFRSSPRVDLGGPDDLGVPGRAASPPLLPPTAVRGIAKSTGTCRWGTAWPGRSGPSKVDVGMSLRDTK